MANVPLGDRLDKAWENYLLCHDDTPAWNVVGGKAFNVHVLTEVGLTRRVCMTNSFDVTLDSSLNPWVVMTYNIPNFKAEAVVLKLA